MKFKKCLIGFLITIGILFALVITATAVVDPFFQYHKPLENFPYLVDNQINQNPGMAKNMDYDSVILGSSMTVNFDTGWFQDLMGLNTLKLCYSGAFPKDEANIMDIIFTHNSHVKKVFLGVDVITYTGDVNQTKYPITDYLYDDKWYNDAGYLLNKDVFLNYILRPLADPDKTDLHTVYKSWWTDDYYNEQYVLHNYEEPDQIETVTPAFDYIDSVQQNLEVNICPYIEANPDTEFVIFFPPYSILYWNDVQKENHMDATINEFKYITNRLMEYDNVSVYFFPDREDIILDLNHYADYSHYHPDFNYFMTECFAGEECKIKPSSGNTEEDLKDPDTMEAHLAHMRAIVNDFDFEELLSRKS